jgi:hypothetical protein
VQDVCLISDLKTEGSPSLYLQELPLPVWGNFPALGELPSARYGQPFRLWASCLLPSMVNRSCFGRAAFCPLWSTDPALGELPSARYGQPILLWASCLLPAMVNRSCFGRAAFCSLWSTVPVLGELPSARLVNRSCFERAAFCPVGQPFLLWASCLLPAMVNRSCFGRAAFCPVGQPFLLWIYFFPFRRFIHVIRMLLKILLISRRGPSNLSDNEGKSFSNSFSQYTVSFASLSAIFILFIKSSMLCALSASAIDAPIAVPERRIWLNKTWYDGACISPRDCNSNKEKFKLLW